MLPKNKAAAEAAIEAVRDLRRRITHDGEVAPMPYDDILALHATAFEISLRAISERHDVPFAMVIAMPYLYLGLDKVR